MDQQSNDDRAEPSVVPDGDRLKSAVRLLWAIFFTMLGYALYFAREFFLPVVLALLFALTFAPLNRWFMRRGLPSPISASIIVFSIVIVFGALAYGLSGPVSKLVGEAPELATRIELRLRNLKSPLEKVTEASKTVEKAATQSSDPTVQKVSIVQPGILSRATGNMVSIATTIGITVVLTLFLLASGMLFYEKVIQSFQLMSDKKRALRIAHDVEREISRYLFTIFIINAVLGLCVGAELWLFSFPDALLFGVIAALVNFLPYVGAFAGVVTVGLISIAQYPTLAMAALPPAGYLLLTVIEGQFVTPAIVGRRLEIPAVAIFLAVAFWGWLWGVAGALIAVPILVVVKTFCYHFEQLHGLGNFLSNEDLNSSNNAGD